LVIDALPLPEILAHLTGPQSTCVISLTRTDAESGDVTSARCGRRSYLIARDYHGDSVRRVSNCAIMLMIEGVELPRLLHVSNCGGPLKVRHTGDIWTRQLLASARIAPSRLDRVIYYPIPRRPTCYRIVIGFTLPGTQSYVPLGERSTTRCDRVAG
jgi:hypothetical protein